MENGKGLNSLVFGRRRGGGCRRPSLLGPWSWTRRAIWYVLIGNGSRVEFRDIKRQRWWGWRLPDRLLYNHCRHVCEVWVKDGFGEVA